MKNSHIYLVILLALTVSVSLVNISLYTEVIQYFTSAVLTIFFLTTTWVFFDKEMFDKIKSQLVKIDFSSTWFIVLSIALLISFASLHWVYNIILLVLYGISLTSLVDMINEQDINDEQ